ncbi:uncharacterized protein [Rutidosis leptorrhynchoides]|uniref:uncharacterized protein isoform X2 n=1 Tax=Rutidosis leptorrhynchoides TaxID=125765 RepID=UPI003A99949D
MESSNSGSFQSSSGAAGGGGGTGATPDIEEYDSRTTTQSTSSFLFNPSANLHNHILQPPSINTTFFNPNQFQDPDSLWTGPVHPNRSNLTKFSNTGNTYHINPPNSRDTNTKTGHGSDHNHQLGVTNKNPKKRTRASRRAPTTVLTTDTTNFRQMVQEFTGIPTAPFTTAAFSNRLDLFRPTAQKLQQLQQQPPFLNSTHPGGNNSSTTTSSYNLPPSSLHEFQKQPSTLMDMQNSMVSFQSLLQSTLSQQSNDLSGYPSSSDKRWIDENEKLEDYEGALSNSQNIGGSNFNSGENVGGSDQFQVA